MGCQVLFIWTLLLISGMQLNSYTNAAFNDIEEIAWLIKTADKFHEDPTDERLDNSSLTFTNKTNIVDCTSIGAWIKNAGDEDMTGESIYHVYYHSNKNPVNPQKITGQLVYEGITPALKKGFEFELTFNLTNESTDGKYKFVAFQRPGHPGENGNIFPIKNAVTFSDNIEVIGCQQVNVVETEQEEQLEQQEEVVKEVDEVVDEDQDGDVGTEEMNNQEQNIQGTINHNEDKEEDPNKSELNVENDNDEQGNDTQNDAEGSQESNEETGMSNE